MKKFLAVILVVLAGLAIVGFILTSQYDVERAAVISAKSSKIHELVGDLRRWNEWTPWKDGDPTMQITLGSETKGVGASQSWTGKDGSGTLTFTAADEDKGVEFDLTFDGKPAKGAIRYERIGDATKVTWSIKGNMDMPVLGGYLALMMDRMVGPEFEKGLSRLKTQSEK